MQINQSKLFQNPHVADNPLSADPNLKPDQKLHPSKRFRKNEHILRAMENMLKIEDNKHQADINEKTKYLEDQDTQQQFAQQRSDEDHQKQKARKIK